MSDRSLSAISRLGGAYFNPKRGGLGTCSSFRGFVTFRLLRAAPAIKSFTPRRQRQAADLGHKATKVTGRFAWMQTDNGGGP